MIGKSENKGEGVKKLAQAFVGGTFGRFGKRLFDNMHIECILQYFYLNLWEMFFAAMMIRKRFEILLVI